MAPTKTTNELYLAVLPLISLANGKTEQFLTVMPDKSFATEFFADEVNNFQRMFENRTDLLIGGHVKGYRFEHEKTPTGRVVVKVLQDVE
jgi:hypothetical protein